jgi:phospholipid-translocating ATPase
MSQRYVIAYVLNVLLSDAHLFSYDDHHSPTFPSQPTMSTLHPPPFASSSRHQISPDASPLHTRNPSFAYTDHSEQHDQVEDLFDPFAADPSLRLRTVRTAHSVIAESIRSEAFQENRRKRKKLFQSMKRKASTMTTRRRHTEVPKDDQDGDERPITVASLETNQRKSSVTLPPSPEKSKTKPDKGKGKAKPPAARRNIHVNIPLPPSMLNPKGDPIPDYPRNKVRTSKYTILTFLPKNLFEQFRRVANIYFLALVILQVFEIFGATNAQIGMLPLIAILGMTAIKDGIEDWRRATLDDEVNNSATTKLGGWRNVNQPKDPRKWWEKILGMGSGMCYSTLRIRLMIGSPR